MQSTQVEKSVIEAVVGSLHDLVDGLSLVTIMSRIGRQSVDSLNGSSCAIPIKDNRDECCLKYSAPTDELSRFTVPRGATMSRSLESSFSPDCVGCQLLAVVLLPIHK